MSCPICKSETDPEIRPFCSQRCADIDLGRWMMGSYRIETEDPAEDADLADPRRDED
ncbi:MAG: DNA gyrase inhibitor YacG [Paracoccaceae bacterium]